MAAGTHGVSTLGMGHDNSHWDLQLLRVGDAEGGVWLCLS